MTPDAKRERLEILWKVLSSINHAAQDHELPIPEKLNLKVYEIQGSIVRRRVASRINDLSNRASKAEFLLRRVLRYVGKPVPENEQEFFQEMMDEVDAEVGKDRRIAIMEPWEGPLKQLRPPEGS